MFFSLVLPKWMEIEENQKSINTGSVTLDNVITVILSSSMFLAMSLGFVLDNSIPGTPEERGKITVAHNSIIGFDTSGLIKWQNQHKEGLTDGSNDRLKVYDLPFVTPWLRR